MPRKRKKAQNLGSERLQDSLGTHRLLEIHPGHQFSALLGHHLGKSQHLSLSLLFDWKEVLKEVVEEHQACMRHAVFQRQLLIVSTSGFCSSREGEFGEYQCVLQIIWLLHAGFLLLLFFCLLYDLTHFSTVAGMKAGQRSGKIRWKVFW